MKASFRKLGFRKINRLLLSSEIVPNNTANLTKVHVKGKLHIIIEI